MTRLPYWSLLVLVGCQGSGGDAGDSEAVARSDKAAWIVSLTPEGATEVAYGKEPAVFTITPQDGGEQVITEVAYRASNGTAYTISVDETGQVIRNDTTRPDGVADGELTSLTT
jgi:hypothetical protein